MAGRALHAEIDRLHEQRAAARQRIAELSARDREREAIR